MEYSLLIAHQVAEPNDRAAQVERLIESLGEWIQIQRSLYILWTTVSPQEVHERIREAMDESDLLAAADINEGFVSNYGALMNSSRRGSLTMGRSGVRIGRASGPH